jgi:hypothetical protein
MFHSSVAALKQNGQTSWLNSRLGIKTRRRGRRTLLAIMALVALAQPAHSDDEPYLETPAWEAASMVKGVYQSYRDILDICREIDGKNAAAYNDAVIALAMVAAPALAQIDKVLRGEAERASKDADWLAEANQDIGHIALTAEDERKYPEKLLANCRIAPEQAKAHIGIFAPLRDQFPKQMHIVEQWR